MTSEAKDASFESGETVFLTPQTSLEEKSAEENVPNESPEKQLKQKLEEDKTGFDEEAFHEVIVSILDMNHLTDARFVRFLFIAAPQRYVARKTLDHIFAYVLTTPKHQKTLPKLKSCLHYLIGLLRFKIIDAHSLRAQYPLYFNLLDHPDLEMCATELIYHTTTYDNIKPWFVSKIQRLYQQRTRRSHLLSLLQLFKRLKLNIVTLMDLPEVNNELKAFPTINQILSRTLKAVATRNDLKHKQEMAFPYSNVNQIALQSKAYPKSLRSYPQFRDLGRFLIKYVQSSYDLYETCYDSMLGNDFNFIFNGILTLEQREHAKSYVQHIWDRIEENEMEEEDILAFLQHLYKISVVLDEDVFDIQDYLSRFVKSHDFGVYSKEILQLYSIINYLDYDSFFKEQLDVLYKNFIIAARLKDIAVMSSIVYTLSKCLYNLYKSKVVLRDGERTRGMSEIDMSLAVNASQHFCKLLMNVCHGDFRAMLSVMCFYERLNDAELLYKLNAINIIPTEISHAFLVSPNLILLDRYAKFINTSSCLGQKYRLGPHHPGLLAIGKQASEIYVFLFRNPMTSQFLQERPLVRNSILFRKVILSKVQGIYVLKHNFAFLHLTRVDADGNWYTPDQQTIHVKRFMNACPYLMGLLTTIKTQPLKDDVPTEKSVA